MSRYLFILSFSLVFVQCNSQKTGSHHKNFLAAVRLADSVRLHEGIRDADTSCPYKTKDSVAISEILSQPVGWTSDYECVFTLTEKAQLDSILRAFEKETTNEIAVVTIDSSWETTEGFYDLILEIHNRWGIGKKTYNNGILFGFSATLRRIKISNGFGLEGIISDLETKKIIDEIIIPEFKEKRYFEGTKKGLLAIINKLR